MPMAVPVLLPAAVGLSLAAFLPLPVAVRMSVGVLVLVRVSVFVVAVRVCVTLTVCVVVAHVGPLSGPSGTWAGRRRGSGGHDGAHRSIMCI